MLAHCQPIECDSMSCVCVCASACPTFIFSTFFEIIFHLGYGANFDTARFMQFQRAFAHTKTRKSQSPFDEVNEQILFTYLFPSFILTMHFLPSLIRIVGNSLLLLTAVRVRACFFFLLLRLASIFAIVFSSLLLL